MAGKTTHTKRQLKKPPAPVEAEELANDMPTRKDLDTVAAWLKLWKTAQPGEAPAIRELAEALGISQTAAVWRLQHCLEKGLLMRREVKALGPYEISDEGKRWLAMAG